MSINLENIGNFADVVIAQSSVTPFEIEITFSEIPRGEVLAEIEKLMKTPGFEMSTNCGLRYYIRVPQGMRSRRVAEEIARCLSEEYGLKVSRLVNHSAAKNNSPNFPIDCFIPVDYC